MDWLKIANEVCQTLLPLVLMALSVTLIGYINNKIEEGKKKSDSDVTDKYLTMLQDTIEDAVLATTQTYVEALKNKNMFDEEAQKYAFQLTYDAIMRVLTDDAKKYIESAVGDLETYITNKIESTVKMSK
jgi:hypothetical protein